MACGKCLVGETPWLDIERTETTRATRYVDLLIEATVPNARRVLAARGEVGFGFAKEWLAEELIAKPPAVNVHAASYTPQGIAAAARRYLDLHRYAQLVLVPRADTSSAAPGHGGGNP